MSELRKQSVYLVDCHDLDKFVAPILALYDLTWRALDTDYDGYNNGAMATATVEVDGEIEDDLDQDFERWLQGGEFYIDDDFSHGPGVQNMLQWLCNENHIPAGKYVVEMWW